MNKTNCTVKNPFSLFVRKSLTTFNNFPFISKFSNFDNILKCGTQMLLRNLNILNQQEHLIPKY